MSMQKSYCKAMRYSGPESLYLKDQTKFDVLINVEVLSGCQHSCTGCFVNKHQPQDLVEPILQEAKRLSDGIKRTGLNLREFVIGPTDFFTATNTKDVLNNEITQSIMRENVNARIATPAKFDLVSMEYMKEIFDILDDSEKYRDDMIMEFIAPIEAPDKMVNDKGYYDEVMRKIEFFKKDTKKLIDWSWTLQSSAILGRSLTKDQYNAILKKSLNEYGTIIEMNPSFSRAPQHKQKENLMEWNKFISRVVDKDNFNNVTMSMANLNCNSMNFIGLTIIMGENGPETHLNVMLHEQAFFTHNERTNVTGLEFEEILERRQDLILEGIEKFSNHPLYKDTPYTMALANRLVWEAIVSMDLSEDEAVLPLDILGMYNPTDNREHLWNEDALKQMKINKEVA